MLQPRSSLQSPSLLQQVIPGAMTTYHPTNKKAKCHVYLRDLQYELGLSDAAIQYMARVAGPRYSARTGELTLTSERYPDREDNRRDTLDMLDRWAHHK